MGKKSKMQIRHASPEDASFLTKVILIAVEVSPFLKSFRFGCAIPRNYCSRNKKSWHEM
jgi:hypothetical protein